MTALYTWLHYSWVVICSILPKRHFLLALMMCTLICSFCEAQTEYEYRFQTVLLSDTYILEHNDPTNNPKINIRKSRSHFSNVVILYIEFTPDGGTAVGGSPTIGVHGLMYGSNAASSIMETPKIQLSDPFTVTMWVYIFTTNQHSWFFGQVWFL